MQRDMMIFIGICVAILAATDGLIALIEDYVNRKKGIKKPFKLTLENLLIEVFTWLVVIIPFGIFAYGMYLLFGGK